MDKNQEWVERKINDYLNRIRRHRKKNHRLDAAFVKRLLETTFKSDDENKIITLTFKHH